MHIQENKWTAMLYLFLNCCAVLRERHESRERKQNKEEKRETSAALPTLPHLVLFLLCRMSCRSRENIALPGINVCASQN